MLKTTNNENSDRFIQLKAMDFMTILFSLLEEQEEIVKQFRFEQNKERREINI